MEPSKSGLSKDLYKHTDIQTDANTRITSNHTVTAAFADGDC